MTNEKSTAKTKDEMCWAMVRPELEAVLEEMWLARVLPLDFGAALERLRLWRGAFGALRMGAARGGV